MCLVEIFPVNAIKLLSIMYKAVENIPEGDYLVFSFLVISIKMILTTRLSLFKLNPRIFNFNTLFPKA